MRGCIPKCVGVRTWQNGIQWGRAWAGLVWIHWELIDLLPDWSLYYPLIQLTRSNQFIQPEKFCLATRNQTRTQKVRKKPRKNQNPKKSGKIREKMGKKQRKVRSNRHNFFVWEFTFFCLKEKNLRPRKFQHISYVTYAILVHLY